MQSFIQKQKMFKLGTKNTLLRCFWAAIQQKQIFNQHTRICETIKVSSKTKKNKLGTKNSLFGSFAAISKNYCHISNQRPPNCLIAKFRAKVRILKVGNKTALFGCFGQQF